MTILRRLFDPAEPPLVAEHAVFGTIRFSKPDCWTNDAFVLWGTTDVQLLLTATRQGPSTRQVEAYLRFRDAQSALLPRCLEAVDAVRSRHGIPKAAFRISALSIPSFTDGPSPTLWKLWFDLEGDDHFMYGVESEDEWQTLTGFADD